MFKLFICVLVLSIVSQVAYGGNIRWSQGTLIHHKVIATWDEAYKQCQREGAVLASPITNELLNKMQSAIAPKNTLHFTGTSARFNKKEFVSEEGIPLHDMPVLDLIEQLDSEQHRCVAMDSNSISGVSCSSRLPYMCYKKTTEDVSLTACGTFDKGYKYVNSTGSCYKFHPFVNTTHWVDAFSMCIAEGGYLAIINDAHEASVVKDFITDKKYYVWIGLVDWDATDEWKSVHGQPLEELHHIWESGEAKSKESGTTRCGVINTYTGVLHDNGDCATGRGQPFLCEKDPPAKGLDILDITSTKIRS